jgi:diguanylate cyclase (GGDEF)-like protein
MSKFKTEILVGSLLLATLALILANQFLVRSYEITPENASRIGWVDDRQNGGSSIATGEISDGLFKFGYKVNADSFGINYSIMSIFPDEEFKTDLSWVEQFEIKIRSDKSERDHVIFYVRNSEPGVTVVGDETSTKCSERLLSLSDEMQTITVDRDEFRVPNWWQQQYSVSGKAANPSFNDVQSFEFNVNSTGEGEIQIASIRGTGNWINSAALNQCLLWVWLGGMMIGVIYRMLTLKKRLSEESAKGSQLKAHNKLLISESATYHELACRDPLTGLYNRYGLESELEEQAAKHYFDYSMLLLDLDKFKEINDNFGHSYGDRVLFDVATIVRSMIGSKDIAARWGGDEFLIILHKRDVAQASEFAEDVRQAVLASGLAYSCSFGICKSEIGKKFESTFSEADAALYKSKNGGRNRISRYPERGDCKSEEFETAIVPGITLLADDLPVGDFTTHE